MAIINEIGAISQNIEKADLSSETNYIIYFGVFFDGTSNNMIQGSKARAFRKNHAKGDSRGIKRMLKYGWLGEGRHKYEQELLSNSEYQEIENAINAGSFKEGYDNYEGKDGGYSNVSILFSKYIGVSRECINHDSNVVTLVYKIYVEGSGANDIKQWNTGISARGLGFGLGKTGVVALVSKAIMAVQSRLKFFEGKENKVALKFDVFGFSRGAACARLFSYMVRRGKEDVLKRESEFKKYYCKSLFVKNKNRKAGNENTQGIERLSFLDNYNYIDSNEIRYGTKEVCFLGIFDTVVSIGMLRRKINCNIDDLKFGVSKALSEYKSSVENSLREFYSNINEATQQIEFLNIIVKESELAAYKELEIYFKSLEYFEDVQSFCLNLFKNIYDNIDKRFNLKDKFLGGQSIINPLRAGFFLDRDFDENLHDLNVSEYGMFSPQLGIPTFHICAMDEFRENFALTDIGIHVPENCFELFLPGCHSDIGGGYICNNTETIVLNKYPTFSLSGIGSIKPTNELAHIFIDSPHFQNGKIEPLGLKSIQKLGWLPYSNNSKQIDNIEDKQESNLDEKVDFPQIRDSQSAPNRKGIMIQGNTDRTKEGIQGVYHVQDTDYKIKWERTVPSFFSNVPLHLMAERSTNCTNRNLFIEANSKSFWPDGFYDIPEGLKDYHNLLRKHINDKGKREWIFPNNGTYSSDEYRILRLFYLHFTAEQRFNISRLWDVQNSTNINGNKNVISRIVYHGDIEDAGNMHYMFEYNKI